MTTIVATLVYIVSEKQLLLGLKKKGFGTGYWNGFGGKPENGETLLLCATREVGEEVGLTVSNLEKVGTFDFYFPHNDTTHEVHVYYTSTFSGEEIETEEMKPEWFSFEALPYEKMWESDKLWLPLLLSKKKFEGTFSFDENNKVLTSRVELVE